MPIIQAPFLGNVRDGDTIAFSWGTTNAAGASITRATDGTIGIRKGSAGPPCTGTAVTDNEDTPLTGIHECIIDTSLMQPACSGGEDYHVYLGGAVIDGQAVNAPLATFSIENRYNGADVISIIGNVGAAQSLKSLTDQITAQGTAQGPGQNGNQIQLAADEPFESSTLDPAVILITGGLGRGQSRRIIDYNGITKVATVSRTWKVIPDATTEYVILADPGGLHVNEGLVGAATAMTITLNNSAKAYDGAYIGQVVFVSSGDAEDQPRRVVSYNGETRTAVIDRPWDLIPDDTCGYLMLPFLGVTAPEDQGIAKAINGPVTRP